MNQGRVEPIIQDGLLIASMVTNDKHGDKYTVSQTITMDILKQVPSGYGGRIGVIPIYNEHDKYYVVLNRSNRNLISDFGGGIKSDFTPYDGLIKELSEEVPFWQEEFMERLESSDPIVHSVEIYYPDNIRHSKEIIRTWTSIFLPIPKYLLNTFTETQEVKELIIIPVEKFSSFLVKNRRSINAGLNMLLKYYYFE